MNGLVSKLSGCAIYTRKSTEHNLDLAFNSLDAQREACEAYIKSQAAEGWRSFATITTMAPTRGLPWNARPYKRSWPMCGLTRLTSWWSTRSTD
jgi:hypothetical protein